MLTPERTARAKAIASPHLPAAVEANPWVVLAVVCLGFVMILVDTTIVNIAVPSLVYALLLVPASRLGDLFGRRNLFALGLLLSPPPQQRAASPRTPAS